MKIYDILVESAVTEAPMGVLKTIGNKIASKMPGTTGSKATGALETGQIANQLKVDFYKYLGQTGQEADSTAVLDFLKSQGYPTDAAASIVPTSTTARPARIEPTASPVTEPNIQSPTADNPVTSPAQSAKSTKQTPTKSSDNTAGQKQATVSEPARRKTATKAKAEPTPAEKRQARQATATATARKQMADNPVTQQPFLKVFSQ